jgi:hypothetical protein
LYSSFTEIQSILYQYDQISSFISSCKEFSYFGTSLSDSFPVLQVQANIVKANAYLSNNLDNPYVNNCTNLRIGLKEVPQYFFNAQIRYLDNKINYCSGSYSIYNSQKAYNTGLYLPLKVEIEGLDNNLYNAANYDSERKRLLLKWQDEASKAYYHFN